MNSTNCPVCDGTLTDVVEEVSLADLRKVWERHYPCTGHLLRGGEGDTITILGCQTCQLEWAASSAVAEAGWYEKVESYPTARWEYDIVLRHIIGPATLIELGCGPGHFLRKARAAGIDAIGFDINAKAVRQGRSEGLTIFAGGLAEALALRAKRREASVIVAAFHFIEHVEALQLLGSGLSELAAAVHLSFPNPDRWTRHLLPSWRAGKHEMWNYPPWHQTRWNRQAIAAFAERFGFELKSYEAEPLSLTEVEFAVAEETGLEGHSCRTLVEQHLAALAAQGKQVGGRSCYAHLIRR